MSSSEQQPLLRTAHEPARRPRQSTSRRFCNIAISSSFLGFLLLVLIPQALFDEHRHNHWPPHYHQPGHRRNDTARSKITYAELQEILLTSPDPDRISNSSYYYTHGSHLAGQNYSQALWTKEKWEDYGLKSDIVTYETLINYPLDHRLALYQKPSGADNISLSNTNTWVLKFEASLEEDVLEEVPTTGSPDRVPTFHGYSATGNVTGSFVYVNYGSYWDFEDLLKANVSLKGRIAIARYGGIFRGLKVKRAQELGMIGVVLFSEPGDDRREDPGELTYPDGPARNPSSVQRGSVQFLSIAPGDPTTPGYPSKPGVPRGSTEGFLPEIPSLPISYRDAVPILKALNGHGLSATKDLNQFWSKNLGLGKEGVRYNIGPTPDNIVLNLVNEQNYTITPIWNVIGIINGTIPDEVIVIGNHRDAWIVGGATDPNSGSATLNEVIRALGIAAKKGWKPLRTLVFASWDGEEYGLVGSTEWVEEYLPWLSAANVAYINLDSAVSGTRFAVSSAPLLNNIVIEVAKLVQSPNQTIPGQTVFDLWDGEIHTMGSGSDFTAFQDFAGVPSIDMGFGGERGDPVYHYHSNYDSYHWMSTYGDPGFKYHATVARLLGLFVARLSESPVIPLNTTDYGLALQTYVKKILAKLPKPTDEITSERYNEIKTELRAAAKLFTWTAQEFELWKLDLAYQFDNDIPWWRWWKKLQLIYAIRKVNTQTKLLERQFLYQKGLDGRSWFKHVIFAPGLWTGYAGAVFPGIDEAIANNDLESIERWKDIIVSSLRKAEFSLRIPPTTFGI